MKTDDTASPADKALYKVGKNLIGKKAVIHCNNSIIDGKIFLIESIYNHKNLFFTYGRLIDNNSPISLIDRSSYTLLEETEDTKQKVWEQEW